MPWFKTGTVRSWQAPQSSEVWLKPLPGEHALQIEYAERGITLDRAVERG
jgi:hypothetical protein